MEIFPFGGGVKKDIKIEAMSQKLDAYLCGNFFLVVVPKKLVFWFIKNRQ